MRNCARCTYSHVTDVYDAFSRSYNPMIECRVNPPHAPREQGGKSRWPIVTAEDWCGKFIDKLDVPPQG